MAKVFLPLVFVALADFERPVTVGLTPDEFKATDFNSLPRESLLQRSYQVTEACAAAVRGFSVQFKANKKIRDTKLALALIEQDKPIVVYQTLAVSKGMVLPEAIGRALKEVYPDLIAEQEVKDPVAVSSNDDGQGADPTPPAPKPPKAGK